MTKLRMLILLATGLTLIAIRYHKPEDVEEESVKSIPTAPAQVAEKKRIEALEAENLKAYHRENPDKEYLKYKSKKSQNLKKRFSRRNRCY